MDTSEEAVIAKNKKDGFSRQEPEEEPLKRQTESQFECRTCDKTLESQGLLDAQVCLRIL